MPENTSFSASSSSSHLDNLSERRNTQTVNGKCYQKNLQKLLSLRLGSLFMHGTYLPGSRVAYKIGNQFHFYAVFSQHCAVSSWNPRGTIFPILLSKTVELPIGFIFYLYRESDSNSILVLPWVLYILALQYILGKILQIFLGSLTTSYPHCGTKYT